LAWLEQLGIYRQGQPAMLEAGLKRKLVQKLESTLAETH
jgi:hypothetical protein